MKRTLLALVLLPAIQGSIDYAHDSGFAIGVFGSNAYIESRNDTEFDFYGTYTHELGDITLSAMAFWYNYVRVPGSNGM